MSVGMKEVRQRTDFPRALFISLVGFAIAGSVLFFWTFSTSQEEEALYHQLSQRGSLQTDTSPGNGYQSRSSTQKDLLFTKEAQRLQLRLTSDTGMLYFVQQGDRNVMMEEMDKVQGILQEELLEKEGRAVQRMKHLAAATAIYNYSNQTLIGDDVQVRQYEIPGHEFVSDVTSYAPLMQGRAAQMEIVISQGYPEIRLRNFTATMGSKP